MKRLLRLRPAITKLYIIKGIAFIIHIVTGAKLLPLMSRPISLNQAINKYVSGLPVPVSLSDKSFGGIACRPPVPVRTGADVALHPTYIY